MTEVPNTASTQCKQNYRPAGLALRGIVLYALMDMATRRQNAGGADLALARKSEGQNSSGSGAVAPNISNRPRLQATSWRYRATRRKQEVVILLSA